MLGRLKKFKTSRELIKRTEAFLNKSDTATTVAKTILAALFAAGEVAVVSITQNAKTILGGKKYRRVQKYSSKQILSALYYLRKRKNIKIRKESGGKSVITITDRGMRKVRECSLYGLEITRPKKWAGRWYLVTFDIPVRYNRARDALRDTIRRLGLIQLQKSMWIFPHPCFDEVLFTAHELKIERFIELIIVQKLSSEKKIKRRFRIR